ncbi:heavy metal-responsive transcriptional regulator [Corallococcus terminator]|uniref:Heavy metal-responsive transcriptional regulator n=1 Tax=Corallococcus terminator TaxID=2316733 RepID=A0A3A8I1Y5_9BACT|nr:heavy metal-responsive transcriptional regulator [Corallococcus terminator]RKG77457.1 heavy metal-responsive transcriptional regulator [Corallococcus terminator]
MAASRRSVEVPPMVPLRIGALARAAGVKLSTLRFYERRRLLTPLERSESGQRLYGPEAVIRVRFIRRSQELGFTLKEVSALLAVTDRRGTPTRDVTRFAEEKVQAIDARIEDLRRMRRAITTLMAEGFCAEDTVCPIQVSLGAPTLVTARKPRTPSPASVRSPRRRSTSVGA